VIAPGRRFLGLLLSLSFLLLGGNGFAQTADLEIVSIAPSSPSVMTDETFQFTVRVRNLGPDAAQQVSVAAGVNALSLFRSITGPPAWTCDAPRPWFGYALNCSIATLEPLAEAEFSVILGAPQHTATTYRLSARAATPTADPVNQNDTQQLNMTLRSSPVQAELAMSAVATEPGRVRLDVRNNGPDAAQELTAVVTGSEVTVSGSGWNCGAPGTHVACTRGTLSAGATAALLVRATDVTKPTVVIESRVRAEKNDDSNRANSGTTVTVTPVAEKSKRRAARP
jgi:hypothetical protein